MLQFEEYFSNNDIREGYHDFRNNAISNLQIHDSSYKVLVQKRYQATITLEHGALIDMECDCQDAEIYGTCQHIAALCYALEDGNILLDHQKKQKVLHHRLNKMSKHELQNILLTLCEEERNYEIMMNYNNSLSKDIAQFCEYNQYQMDYTFMKKQFKKFNKIMSKLEHMTLHERFPYVLELMESFYCLEEVDDDQCDQLIEVKDMLYAGIIQKEKDHLAWFWEQMEHPAQVEEDLIDLFHEMFHDIEAIAILKHQLSKCQDPNDIEILLTMLISNLEDYSPQQAKQLLSAYESYGCVHALYSRLHEKEGNYRLAMDDIKKALSCKLDSYDCFLYRKKLYELSFLAKDLKYCLTCFRQLLSINEKQAYLYYKKVKTLLKPWKDHRGAFLGILEEEEKDRKAYLLLEDMRNELYELLSSSTVTLEEVMQYDICFFPDHQEELYHLYYDEIQILKLKPTHTKLIQSIIQHLLTLPDGQILANRLSQSISYQKS